MRNVDGSIVETADLDVETRGDDGSNETRSELAGEKRADVRDLGQAAVNESLRVERKLDNAAASLDLGNDGRDELSGNKSS